VADRLRAWFPKPTLPSPRPDAPGRPRTGDAAVLGRAHDVLVATTIHRERLDIPNVNTIIVNQARILVEQLTTARRVGRSQRQAYCYLFYPDRALRKC